MTDAKTGLRYSTCCVLIVAAVASSACEQQEAARPADPAATIRIVTGPQGLTFAPLGAALAEAYGRLLPDLRFEAIPTPGASTNLQRLQAGEAELAFSVANVAYAAYGGLDAQFRPSAHSLRTIAVLHPSAVHILVRADSTARALTDLRGRVAVGPEGSGMTAKMLIEQFSHPARVVMDEHIALTDAPEALADGRIDAAIVVAADPVDVVARAMAKGAKLLSIANTDLERLRADYPFLRPGTIPAGTYAGEPRAVATMVVDVLLVTRAGIDDDVVRRLTSALFNVLPELAGQFTYLRLMNMQRAPATPIPLHPGAALFYRERELSR